MSAHHFTASPYTAAAYEQMLRTDRIFRHLNPGYTPKQRRHPAGAHRPETLGRHAVSVQQLRTRAAITDMRRLCTNKGEQ